MTFGQRLGMLRKERGYTQKTFAQELSVTERCIRAYENETRHPDYFGLIALADYFNVSLDYLVGRSDRRAAFMAARGRPPGSPLRRYVLGRVPCWMYPCRWGLTLGLV